MPLMAILLLKKFKRLVLDFIFPKSAEVIRAEKMTASEILLEGEKIEPPDNPFITALFSYRDPLIKALIWEVKYRQNEVIADKLGELMREKIVEEIGSGLNFLQKPLLAPIPISKKRLRERGFNQAEILAQKIFEITPETFIFSPSLLCKTKETPPQAKIKKRTERLLNLADSFAVKNPSLVKGKRCVGLGGCSDKGGDLRRSKGRA